MRKTLKTNVIFILDKSGSMSTVQDVTISGFNEYIDTLKKDKKGDYAFSLTLFDTSIEKKLIEELMSKVSRLDKETYRPNGMTALYDAVCYWQRPRNQPKATAGKSARA